MQFMQEVQKILEIRRGILGIVKNVQLSREKESRVDFHRTLLSCVPWSSHLVIARGILDWILHPFSLLRVHVAKLR